MHCSTPDLRQKLAQGGLHPWRTLPVDGLIPHTVHPPA
jgi:hypothetical protein